MAQAELARRFHFSPGYFSHYFKDHTGITFMQYLTQMRLQKACADLLSSDLTIAQISLAHGFADERSFINKNIKQIQADLEAKHAKAK